MNIMDVAITGDDFFNPPPLLKLFMDVIDSGVLLIDAEYNIIWMNKQKRDNNPDVQPGMKCYDAFEEYGMRCPFCIASEAMSSGRIQKNQYYVAIQKGEELPVHMNITVFPVYDKEGELLGSIEIAYNVEDLYQTNMRLERLNKEYEHVIYALSHDLRSPLVSIEGFLRKIKKYLPGGDDKAQHYFERIRVNIGLMNGLVKVLLDTSRIATGRLEIQSVDMDFLVSFVIKQFSQRVEKIGAKIIINNHLGHYRCDKVRMQQVFTNLISNALDHCKKKKGLEIEIGFKNHVFWVRDNGPGIPRDFVGRVFDAFTQATDTSTEHLGMGMSIVYKIIKKHGGDTWIDSTLGEGTVVYFTLLPGKSGNKYRS